ncbi:MAG: outer membrane protein transport protein [Marinifilaceae bacterium]|jgi:hypothetical protein|nr:outer membrane protein transport protein [Marinifilaceae bacterium]
MKKIFLLLLIYLIHFNSFSQIIEDAVKYSINDHYGSARVSAMGGAFTALGGDYGSISINPAGLGLFRSSAFSLTPSLKINNSSTGNFDKNKFNFGLSNLGLVLCNKYRLAKKDGFQSINFSIGYNKIKDFNRNSFSQVEKSNNSLLHIYQKNADGNEIRNLNDNEFFAYQVYLIDTIPGDSKYFSIPYTQTESPRLMENIKEEGYISEINFASAVNIGHKLYIGASLGIVDVYYKSKINYSEYSQKGTPSQLDNFVKSSKLKTTGVGVNFKLGIIYKPIQQIRIGASLHTPTRYRLEDESSTSYNAKYREEIEDGKDEFSVFSDINYFKYDLSTPMRMNFGTAFILKKRFIISGDIELLDYSSSRFKNGDNGVDFYGTDENPDTNDLIKEHLDKAYNLKLGAEFKANNQISLRAGYSKFGTAYKKSISNINDEINRYSAGIGYQEKNFNLDISYALSMKEYLVQYFNHGDIYSPILKNKNNTHLIQVSLGFKF